MPDITMCINDKCPSAKLCYRHETEPNPSMQEYADFAPINGEVACGEFIELFKRRPPPAQEAQPVGTVRNCVWNGQYWRVSLIVESKMRIGEPLYALPPDAARRIAELEAERNLLKALPEKLDQTVSRLVRDLESMEAERDRLREALTRAERKLAAYVGACTGDKELTEAVLPLARAALGRES